ncbi:uncharacterized protein DUF4260 [Mucilaginibacter gracilis]|uniref:Uncharacterized protein DUF4260 n=1 Tax=Mucilaginibacter gracilis TaxID=423350 RepID=A0A495J076_9SPHI|nr:DUF4260 domain-containing protein [Mucilaginibacter gracilis]RKR82173.1 uncharacterized protein DUF4260 [Mucilaginibacter gracilis]
MSNANKPTANQGYMQNLIRAEEVAITGIAVYFLTKYNLGLSIWIWIPLFLSPDISMLGYIRGEKTGAFWYNLFHHRGVALVVAALGYYLHNDICTTIGILLFAHASFDRIMDYGLKFPDSFKHTHLGWKKEKQPVAAI